MAYITPEAILALSEPDPEFDAYVKEVGIPPRDFSDLIKLRNGRKEFEIKAIADMGPPPPSVQESKEAQTTRDGHVLTHILWKPVSPSIVGAPLIVLVHGGGFCIGGAGQNTGIGRALCELYRAMVISLDYRLAPEHKFPTSAEDCWEGLVWAAESASRLGVDLKRGFLLGGVSAGGNVTAVLAQKSIEEGGLLSPLTGLYISVPVVLDGTVFDKGWIDPKYKEVYLSKEHNANAPILNTAGMTAYTNGYAPDWTHPLATPFAAKNPHVNMPKSYFQVCGMDPVRDDGLIYERVLREHGVQTKIDVFPGLPHASWTFLPSLKSTENIVNKTIQTFGWLLDVEPKEPVGKVGAAGG